MIRVLLLASLVAVPGWLPSGQPDRFDWSGPVGSSKSFLTATGHGSLLLTWFERRVGNHHALMIAERRDGRWSTPRVVAESDRFFVNWADFPSVAQSSTGTWAVHWLEKTAAKSYAYHVRLTTSADQGRTWTAPITVHRDTTPTEHGFVAMVPGANGSIQITWLDGRAMVDTAGAMSVRTTAWLPGGGLAPETMLDPRTCECCQVSMARTSTGLIAAYRDRSLEEVRDIAVVREVGGRWTEPKIVADDRWVWKACPVNGPAIAANGQDVGVAWFTAAGGKNAVKFAGSANGGATFNPPVRVDLGNTLGRVHLQMTGPATAVVTWLEASGDGAAWYARRIARQQLGRPVLVGQTARTRDGGFARTAILNEDIFITWTDPGSNQVESRIRVKRIPLAQVK